MLPSRHLVPERLERLIAAIAPHRARIASLVMIAGVIVVGLEISRTGPQDVDVALPIGAGHDDVTQVDVAYLEDGDLVRRVSLRFPEGAPSEVRDTVELAPGSYDVSVDLRRDDGSAESRAGRLDAPADGVVRVVLHEGAD
jgi:hypothetical protein